MIKAIHYICFVVAGCFFSTLLQAQTLEIAGSNGFNNPYNLIDGTSATTTTSGSTGSKEITLALVGTNYINNLTLQVSGGSNFSCEVYTSKENGETTSPVSAYVGSNTIEVDAYADYIHIDVSLSGGSLALEELLAGTEYRSIAYVYDVAGNRISRSLSIRAQKNSLQDEYLIPDENHHWDEMGIVFYPNPTDGEILLEFKNFPTDEKVRYQLFDYAGKQVLEQAMYNTSTLIDLKEFPDGNYILRLFVGQELKTYQIVKQ